MEDYQYENLRNELPDHQRLILVIGFHLGMRRGEILNLRWDQVDWAANLLRLEKKQTKGKQARVAPLYGELRSVARHGLLRAPAGLPVHRFLEGRRHLRSQDRLEQGSGTC